MRLILLFIVPLLLLSQEFKLQKKYYFKDDGVYAKDLFPELGQNFMILEAPRHVNKHTIQSSVLIERFKEYNISVATNKEGVVELIRDLQIDMEKIKERVKEEMLSRYGRFDIKVADISLELSSFNEIDGYEINEVLFGKNEAKKSSGTFGVIFKNREGKIKRLYMKYSIDATLLVLKAKDAMYNGVPLSAKNSELKRVKFDKFPFELATTDMFEKYETKAYLTKNSIIYTNQLKPLLAIKRGNKVTVVMYEGSISLTSQGVAKESGGIGELITIEMNKKRVSAKVIGKDTVEVK